MFFPNPASEAPVWELPNADLIEFQSPDSAGSGHTPTDVSDGTYLPEWIDWGDGSFANSMV